MAQQYLIFYTHQKQSNCRVFNEGKKNLHNSLLILLCVVLVGGALLPFFLFSHSSLAVSLNKLFVGLNLNMIQRNVCAQC